MCLKYEINGVNYILDSGYLYQCFRHDVCVAYVRNDKIKAISIKKLIIEIQFIL